MSQNNFPPPVRWVLFIAALAVLAYVFIYEFGPR